jgi:AraC-like DNA-binding protein
MILYETRPDNDIYVNPRKNLTCLPHLHHHIEFFYLTDGETEVTIDGEKYLARAGDIAMVFPNQIHAFDDIGEIKGYIVIASPEVFSSFSEIFKNFKLKNPVITVENKNEIESLFKKTCKADKENSLYSKAKMTGYLTVILSLILENEELSKEIEVDLSSLKKILYYCDTHYAEPLSLSVLEKKLGFNRYYISHVFYDKIGIGFSDYINLLRINAAKSKLRHSDDRITDIALDSGFVSIRTFNRQFISLVGMTPNEYREKHISDIAKKEPRN